MPRPLKQPRTPEREHRRRYQREYLDTHPMAVERNRAAVSERQARARYEATPAPVPAPAPAPAPAPTNGGTTPTEGAGVSLVDVYLVLRGTPCYTCGRTPARGVGHLLSREEGGTHALGNLIPRCRSCSAKLRNRKQNQEHRIDAPS
jgi:hypothetical protein